MTRPAVFFDRDNTLIVSDGYLGDPAGVVLVAGAAEAVARARRMGFAVVTVSNQSGVARGMFDENAVRAVNARMDQLLQQQIPAALIDRHEFCPFHPQAPVPEYRQDSDLRKPKAGMLLRAARQLDLDLSRSWIIGDAPRDIEAGKAAGCRTILFQDQSLPPSPAAEQSSQVRPEFVVASLKEAMDMIEQQTNGTPATPSSPSSSAPAPDLEAIHATAQQILQELRRRRERETTEFSVTKLLAGIVQIIVLAVLFFAYLYHNVPQTLNTLLLLALTLQALTIALLVMGKQR